MFGCGAKHRNEKLYAPSNCVSQTPTLCACWQIFVANFQCELEHQTRPEGNFLSNVLQVLIVFQCEEWHTQEWRTQDTPSWRQLGRRKCQKRHAKHNRRNFWPNKFRAMERTPSSQHRLKTLFNIYIGKLKLIKLILVLCLLFRSFVSALALAACTECSFRVRYLCLQNILLIKFRAWMHGTI